MKIHNIYICNGGPPLSDRETYLDFSKFTATGVKVEFQEFKHPVYTQQSTPFVPYMSSIDLLFNCGSGSKDILFGKTKRIDYVSPDY
ncbi:MAG: WbqC family protein [Nanoarchaeota archaeon]|nr:WbqC family protein [Nanoarchaeota archaeon]